LVVFRHARSGAFAIATLLGSAMTAHAQTSDYFATPWELQPEAVQQQNTPTLPANAPRGGLAATSKTVQAFAPSSYSNLYGFSTEAGNPRSPAWIFEPHIGVTEILTDNVFETKSDKQADLITDLSAGVTIRADTAHLTGLLDYDGVLQRYLHAKELNDFSQYLFSSAHATLIPGEFYFDLHANIDDVRRDGSGLINPLLQAGNTTQTYTISGSPYFSTRLGKLGYGTARYTISQVWFNQNTGPLSLPVSPLFPVVGPISSATQQELRGNVKLPGTVIERLATEFAASGLSNDTGSIATGNFERASGQMINEYELTRSLSLIGTGGYEALKDDKFSSVSGQGVTWDVGARWRPNADSSFLILYGRHDLKSDISGEIQYRFTPFTSFYAAYTDSISTSQQSVLANNDASFLSAAGAVSGITFDQNSVISALNDSSQQLDRDPDTLGVPFGIPLSDVDNFSPLQNGIFRTKSFRAVLYSNFGSPPDSFALTVYNVQSDSLTGPVPPDTTTKGVDVTYSKQVTRDLNAFLDAGYSRQNIGDSNIWNAGIGATYDFSDKFFLRVRYDYIRRDAEDFAPGGFGSGYIQNAVTISLLKSF
jgi:predicted porin